MDRLDQKRNPLSPWGVYLHQQLFVCVSLQPIGRGLHRLNRLGAILAKHDPWQRDGRRLVTNSSMRSVER